MGRDWRRALTDSATVSPAAGAVSSRVPIFLWFDMGFGQGFSDAGHVDYKLRERRTFIDALAARRFTSFVYPADAAFILDVALVNCVA